MTITRRTSLLAGAAILTGLALGLPSASQANFPNQRVRVIVPFPAGGTTDVVAGSLPSTCRAHWASRS